MKILKFIYNNRLLQILQSLMHKIKKEKIKEKTKEKYNEKYKERDKGKKKEISSDEKQNNYQINYDITNCKNYSIKNGIKINQILEEISNSENISSDILVDYIKSFEKYIKSETRKYDDITGLEDYKMSKYDYNILYNLYTNTCSSPYKIHIILLYMYSYYKLDGISFDRNHFPLKLFFNFINNNVNIHSLILKLVQS